MVPSGASASAILDLALADPAQARVRATELLEGECGDETRVIALRARGLARRLLGDLDGSIADLDRAAQDANDLGADHLRAGVAITIAGTRMAQARPDQAKAILADCLTFATGIERVEAMFQLGTTHAQTGDLEKALEIYTSVLPQVRQHERLDWEAQLVGNRGVMRIHTGDYSGAIVDLDRAVELQVASGSPAQAAINLHNKAQAVYMQGDLASSLDLYEQAESMQSKLGMPVLMHAQKCEAYLAAGMFEATMVLAREAFDFHRSSGTALGAILSLMPGAEAAMALGQYKLAAEMAEEAERIGGEQFPTWTARSQLTAIEARAQQRTTTSVDVDRATLIAGHVGRSDSVTAARALLVAAELAIQQRDLDRSFSLLEQAKGRVQKCPLHIQIERWRLVAQVRQAAGNRQGTLRAVYAGLRAFNRLQAGVPSYDVRARTLRYAEALVETGVRELVAASRLEDAVSLIEQLRGGAVMIGHDRTMNSQALRNAETALRRGQGTGSEVLQMQTAVARLAEREPADLALRSDETRLSYIDLDERLLCVASSEDGHQLHDCGAITGVSMLLSEQAFLHRQLARRSRLTESARLKLLTRTKTADAAIAERLLPSGLGSRVLINPSPSTSGTHWSALPGLFERPHTIVFSTSLARRTLPKKPTSAVVVGSSNLAHVSAELEMVAAIHGEQPDLDPPEIISKLSGIDLLHAAGHFTNHGENPLFSELPLGAVRLRGDDLLTLTSAPRIAVLSACSTGTVATLGGAPFGFATALLAAGSASILVTQAPIEDGAAIVSAMANFHQALADGQPPADAALSMRNGSSDTDRPIVAALTVLGAGW